MPPLTAEKKTTSKALLGKVSKFRADKTLPVNEMNLPMMMK